MVRPIAGVLAALCLVAQNLGVKAASSELASAVVETGPSHGNFYIEPSYDGTTLVLFGAIVSDRLDETSTDLAVIFRGPPSAQTVWRKHQLASAFWVNADRKIFETVPNFYAALSTKPLSRLAPIEIRKIYGIGLDAIDFHPSIADVRDGDTDFVNALIRLKRANRLYLEDDSSGISFFGRKLFRVRVFLPASAGPGVYRATTYLFQNGQLAASSETKINVRKIGIEARLSSAALEHPLLYGLIAVVLAAAIGGGASIVLRRA